MWGARSTRLTKGLATMLVPAKGLAYPALVSLHATALNTNLYAAYTLSMPRLVCARQTFFETVSSLPTPILARSVQA